MNLFWTFMACPLPVEPVVKVWVWEPLVSTFKLCEWEPPLFTVILAYPVLVDGSGFRYMYSLSKSVPAEVP
jgi:hypothetical protein